MNRNSSDLDVCLSSMPVNWEGRVAIRDLSRQSRGDFQPIDAKSTSCSTSSPWPGERGSLLWGTPPHPPARTSPLHPFPGFSRSDVLSCGRPSLERYYAHTEQVPQNLNTYHLPNGRLSRLNPPRFAYVTASVSPLCSHRSACRTCHKRPPRLQARLRATRQSSAWPCRQRSDRASRRYAA